MVSTCQGSCNTLCSWKTSRANRASFPAKSGCNVSRVRKPSLNKCIWHDSLCLLLPVPRRDARRLQGFMARSVCKIYKAWCRMWRSVCEDVKRSRELPNPFHVAIFRSPHWQYAVPSSPSTYVLSWFLVKHEQSLGLYQADTVLTLSAAKLIAPPTSAHWSYFSPL